MSNSALANYIDRTNGNYTSRQPDTLIDCIMLHSANQKGDRYDMAELINGGTSGYHYGIANDGTVGLFVDECNAAFGCSNEAVNDRCVHILLMNVDDSMSCPITKETREMLFKLVEDICRRNFITTVTFNDKNHKESTIQFHSWYDATRCPGAAVKALAPILADEVSARIKSARITTEAEALKAQSTIAVGAIDPYMVCPEYDALGVNYNKLKTMGAVGSMFWAGSYFDADRRKRERFINPNLKQQIQECELANLPFALYTDVRARSVAEAKQEAYEFYFVLSKYPPKLGIWLHIDSKAPQNTLIDIIELYYSRILRWGLKSKCGFYITPQTLQRINWPRWIDKFSLWIIDPLPEVGTLTQVLTPTLFKV